MGRRYTLADGQLAASSTTILAGSSLDNPDGDSLDISCTNTAATTETVIVTLARAGGTARRIARAVLAQNEELVITGLKMQGDDTLAAYSTNVSAVDYLVTGGSQAPFGKNTFDSTGSLKSTSATASGQTSGFTVSDDGLGAFGTGQTARFSYDTTDANANALFLQLPAGGAVDVPVLAVGQSIESVDLGLYNGVVDPRVAMFGVGAVATGPSLEFRKARGSISSPTVVTTADDIGSIDFYGCVAAGEYVQGARIFAETKGTIATTRGPGVLYFQTATDAAPSVLTTAITISAAQLVTCAAGLTLTTGDLTFVAASDIIGAANTDSCIQVTDGTTALLDIDSRNTVTVDNITVNQPASQTLPDAATARFRLVNVAAPTVTLVGQTQVTTVNDGAVMSIQGPTYNQSGGAVTVDEVSTLYVGTVTAGASVTITTQNMITTGVADCFLTNAGVWTDTACWSYGKNDIVNATRDAFDAILDKITPKTWTYKEDIHGDDLGRQRVGITYDDLPDELGAPGRERGVSPGILSSFALGMLRYLRDENRELRERIAALESA